MNQALLHELLDHHGGTLDQRLQAALEGKGPSGDAATDLAALLEMPLDEARHLVNVVNTPPGNGVWFPASWGFEGAKEPKGLARIKIVR